MKPILISIFTLSCLIHGPCFSQKTDDSIDRFDIDETMVGTYRRELDSLYLSGEYKEAMEKALILNQFYIDKGNMTGEIWCMNYLGDLLRAYGDFPPGLNYLYKALALNQQLNDTNLLAQTYNYLAATYVQYEVPDRLDSADHYARLSLEYARKVGNERIEYSSLNILGVLNCIITDYPAALRYLTEAHQIVKRVYPVDEPLILSNLAIIYENTGQPDEAEKLLLEAFNQAKQNQINAYIRLSSSFLSRHYSRKKDYQQALFYQDEYWKAMLKNYEEKAEVRINALLSQIEIGKKETELERLKALEILNQKEQLQRKIWVFLLLFLILVAVGFVVMFALQKRRLKKTCEELVGFTNELKYQKQQTEEMAEELHQANATLKKFISLMAHDLKNPFNTIIGFSDLLKTEFDTLTPDERKVAIENTHKSAVTAFSLLEQLLSWARLQTGTFRLELSTIDLSDLIDEVVLLSQAASFLKKQQLEKNIPPNLLIRADRNMMLAVFRNLLSNAIKFTPEHGRIELSATRSDKSVHIQVRDSGVGIPETEIGKLFLIDEPYKTTGTSGEKGTGIGLLLCKEYLEKNNGTISVASQEGKGTTFTVTLPLVQS